MKASEGAIPQNQESVLRHLSICHRAAGGDHSSIAREDGQEASSPTVSLPHETDRRELASPPLLLLLPTRLWSERAMQGYSVLQY
jgi:hypothetical protein